MEKTMTRTGKKRRVN